VQFLETRFNSFIRQLFAWAGIPVKIFDDALKVFATGLFVSVSVGVNLQIAILVCGAVMIAYTFLGGLWALVVTDYVQFLMKAIAILLLFPLAIRSAGGWDRAVSNLPAGFFRPVGEPYGWLYVAGFTGLIIISYNASWSLAQKYYSVADEREASKAAYCAAALNLVGAPLMILPAIIGRNLLPDLIAQNRTADVYVMLILKLLPVGMIGIIMAAMFSATMAVVSADFNAIASVLTKDVYQRLFRPGAQEGDLLVVGRLATLLLGVITTILSLWIGLSRQQALFNTMVTVLGLFMAPTFLPLLAGLTSRRLNWQGALGGFVAGLTTGSAMLVYKNLRIVGTDYTFEGISLLANIGMTIVGMIVGTTLGKPPAVFANLDRPITPDEVPAASENPASRVLGLSTISVGGLLGVAGLLSGAELARTIDVAAGAALVVIGVVLYRSVK
jgi:SSS family solute:Na+ symporter